MVTEKYESYSFTGFGIDVKDELKRLYSEGWRLVTCATLYACSLQEGKMFNMLRNTNNDKYLYSYVIEYYLERKLG